MVKFVARQTLDVAAGMLLLAAVALPCAGFAQSLRKLRPRDPRQRQIVSKIQQIQSQSGPYSADLLDPLSSLILSYEERGDHESAVVAIEETRQVVRANYGLYSVREARLIWQEIGEKKASGETEAAWNLEQKLLAHIKRHPDDPGIVPILQGIAEERMDILRRYRAGQLPPAIILGCYYQKRQLRPQSHESRSHCLGGSRDDVVHLLFAEARSYYGRAIGVMYRKRRYSSPKLHELEASLIRTSYMSADYIRTRTWSCCLNRHDLSMGYEPRSGPSPDYVAGERSYRRLVGYNAADSAPLLVRVKTRVAMTDWNLLFSQKAGTAVLDGVVKTYEQAYQMLEQRNVAQASIDAIFAPKIPVVLPSFLRNPLISEKTPQTSGYIDVAFEITKYGWGKHLGIVDKKGKVTRAAERDLIHLIKRSQFRPRLSHGHVADTSRVVVRYFFNP